MYNDQLDKMKDFERFERLDGKLASHFVNEQNYDYTINQLELTQTIK